MCDACRPKPLETDFRKDIIPVLTSRDQYINSSYSLLGMDTEMLLVVGTNNILWPHTLGFPQERTPGDKKVSVKDREDRGSTMDFHADGYALELCVPAVHCLEYMMENIGLAMKWLKNNKALSDKPPKIEAPVIYRVPQDIIDAAPAEVKRLGCMPSLNVYEDSGDPNALPDDLRTTGCHLHMSHKLLRSDAVALDLVKWADIMVGCAWTYISPNSQHDEALRRISYGRAGEFRRTEYKSNPPGYDYFASGEFSKGVEYRVLPGTVIKHPAYLTLMFNLFRTALRFAAQYKTPPEDLSTQAREAINTADKKLAKQVLSTLNFDGGNLLLDSLHTKPLRGITLNRWYTISQNHNGYGHQKYYQTAKRAESRAKS